MLHPTVHALSRSSSAAADARSARRLVLAALALALTVCALTGYWLWVLRDHRLDFTDRQIRLQTAAVAEHVQLVLDAAEVSLAAVDADLHGGRLDGRSTSAGDALRAQLRANPRLHALWLEDADGRVLAASGAESPAPSRGTLALTRNVAGAPHGVERVVARLDDHFVGGYFARVAYAKDARVGLFGLDGQRLAGDIDLDADFPAIAPSPAALLQRLLTTPREAGTAHARVFAAAQPIRGLPMVALTLRERDAVLAPWRAYLVDAASACAVALAALALIVRRLWREMHARAETQAALERTRDELQVRLQRTRRLESLGRLSGGIAHDFNNILAVILGHGELLQQGIAPGSAAARQIDQLLRAGERGKRLVARILGFSRGGGRPAARIGIDSVVGEAIELLAASAPAQPAIRFELALAAPGAQVLGDAALLFEALGNLCTNAIHAMPDGGRLTVRSETLQTAAEQPLSHGALRAGAWVRLTVADEGLGMGGEVIEHLFEPFFTTRAAQGGTGLGLAMVHGAVREMNGVIDVQSAPGAGARFALYFPLAAPGDSPEPVVLPVPHGHGQVVMIVDDDPALVSVTEELVAGLGYEPVGFTDPRQALAALQAAPERFDAVLTDQIMPTLAGTELARQARTLRPQLPILLASGYGGPDLDHEAETAGVTRLLHKPLQRAELAHHLAHALAVR